MSPVTHTIPSNYYANQYPIMNNTNSTKVSNNATFMQTPVLVQRPNLSASAKNIQHANRFSDTWPVSCPTPSNQKTTTSFPTLPPQRNNAPLKPMFYLPSSHPDVQQLNSDTITRMKSKLYGQYVKGSSKMVRPNLVSTVTQETDHNLLAESNGGEQPRLTTNQVTYKIIPQIFTQQQQNSCLQQQHIQLQEQKQDNKNKPLQLMNSVQPLNTQQLQQELQQADVLLPNLNITNTDHNPECTNGVQNLCNSQNAGSSLKKKVKTTY
jgi:hypothetical protein